MVVWQVPVSEDFPQGLKYSSQYMDADGNTLLRYDSAPRVRSPTGRQRSDRIGVTDVLGRTRSDAARFREFVLGVSPDLLSGVAEGSKTSSGGPGETVSPERSSRLSNADSNL